MVKLSSFILLWCGRREEVKSVLLGFICVLNPYQVRNNVCWFQFLCPTGSELLVNNKSELVKVAVMSCVLHGFESGNNLSPHVV